MSDFVIHKGHRDFGTFSRHYGSLAEQVNFSPYHHTEVELSDGRTGMGTCVGCADTPCMTKSDDELALFGILEEFPGNPSRDVCPTKAIYWDRSSSVVTVSKDTCIGCGLCVSRCPYGAISLLDGLNAYIENSDPSQLITIESPRAGEHSLSRKRGQLATLDSPAAQRLPIAIEKLDDAQSTLLIRNLLHEVGLNARTRRRGDTNMRVDAIGFSRNERPFVAEIEMTGAVLESPRALLEDVAILHSRYGYPISNIDPISIIFSFPNTRSEYYQVIRDIEAVLGLRCRTITLGALIALLWNNKKLDGFDHDHFSIDEETGISQCLDIEDEFLIEPYPGAFQPVK